jgi:hypothetical protein
MEDNIINNFDLNELRIKYKDNPYILSRLSTFLNNLPTTLECENKKYEERMQRTSELKIEQENFFKVFLSKYKYYYMGYNNLYYEYDGKSYRVVKDDHIHHKLLTTITNEGKLMPWKHKTKQNIIKQIKERNLFKSVPETDTIQNVLGFLQTIFQTKKESKYFLTVIGDCVLKKNNEPLLFFVSSAFKKMIGLIDSISYITCGNSITNSFITKYHDNHNLSLFRLIKTNENTNTISYDIVKGILNNIGLDLLCVATHYSERYTSSDTYLGLNDDIKPYTMYFISNPPDKIVADFVSQCIEKVDIEKVDIEKISSNISWKNMHYIWKIYLSNLQIPNMIYSNQLQNQLSKLLEHTIDGNIMNFTNITSKYLPHVSSFLLFWEKHIVETSDDDNCDDEYEIDELSMLYKKSNSNPTNISDLEIIKMIKHYFSPQVEVIDNKYIINIRCDLWAKNEDIMSFLQSYKEKMLTNGLLINETETEQQLISLDELYEQYISHCKIKKETMYIVSKHFFEKYLVNSMNEYIKFGNFVSYEWLYI